MFVATFVSSQGSCVFIADIYVFISRGRGRTTTSGGGGGQVNLFVLCLPGPPFAALGRATLCWLCAEIWQGFIRSWLRGSRLKLKLQTQPPRLVLLLQVNGAGERP